MTTPYKIIRECYDAKRTNEKTYFNYSIYAFSISTQNFTLFKGKEDNSFQQSESFEFSTLMYYVCNVGNFRCYMVVLTVMKKSVNFAQSSE